MTRKLKTKRIKTKTAAALVIHAVRHCPPNSYANTVDVSRWFYKQLMRELEAHGYCLAGAGAIEWQFGILPIIRVDPQRRGRKIKVWLTKSESHLTNG